MHKVLYIDRHGEAWGAVIVGVFCVVMTTSCAIRTHCVTITTHKAAGTVSAKQPT